jgi:TPR repeat protein
MKRPTTKGSKAAHLREQGHALSNRGYGLKSFRSFLKAAKLGDEEAQVIIGYDYAYGITGEYDREEAIRWWKRAYRKGSSAAAYNLGMFFRDAKQWKKAVKWFERAVQAGDEDGLIEIAKIHLRYLGDRPAGLRYLKVANAAKARLTLPARLDTMEVLKTQKALSSGDLLYMEAELLDERKRYAEALPLLVKGAEGGDTSCQILLGNYLSDGRKGAPIDPPRAIYWYKRAYKKGCSGGAFNLGMHYRKLEDVNEACRWFERAIAAGDNGAHLALAKIWLHDRRNEIRAIHHLKALFQERSRSTSDQDRDEARDLLRRLWAERK